MRVTPPRSVAVAVAAVASLVAGPMAPPVEAASDSGASSRVVGRGDIVTSILGWGPRRSRGPSAGSAPACVWRTLSDAQLEWLVSVTGQATALGLHAPLLDPLRAHLDAAVDLPESDLRARTCGAATHELRFVPRVGPLEATEQLYRRMVTRLPVPDPTISPPPDAAVPVGRAVFVSVPGADWAPVQGSITLDGTTAEVVAEPVGVRVQPGDPLAEPAHCAGRGRPFEPGTALGAAAQAARPGACTVTYRSPADQWLGTVTVLWSARWRVDGGDWSDLGTIPRTRLVARTVREVTTSITGP